MEKNIIRIYNNKVWIKFIRQIVYISTNVSDIPHYKKWMLIIFFLKKRGFKITSIKSIKENYPTLNNFHKIGYKNDLAVVLEITENSIKLNFGNKKNLWGDENHFWDNHLDERYTKLNYLENCAIRLEIKKVFDFCKKFDLEYEVNSSDLSPEEYIIDSLKQNTHIHGVVNSLNDIKLSMTEDSYNYKWNSNDKNKKKIICGERKYFYDDSTKRLSSGIVWHHINNMWWVISGKKLRNIASFDLFDFDPSLPKKKPVTISKIDELLRRYERARNYDKCQKIYNHYIDLLSYQK